MPQFVITVIVERKLNDFDTAVMADTVEEVLKPLRSFCEVKGIRVRKRHGTLGAAGFLCDQFIVQNEDQFIDGEGGERRFNNVH